MEITTRHWLIALMIASLAHAALALALVQVAEPPAIAPAGISIEIGDGGPTAAGGADGAGSPGSDVMQPVASEASAVSPMAAASEAAASEAAASEAQAQQAMDAEVAPPEQTAALQPVDPVETAAARPLPEPEPEPEPEQTPTPKQTPRPTPDPKPKPKARSDPRAAAQPTPTSETVSQSNRIRSEQTAADAARNRSGFGDADRGAERAASGRGSQSSAGDGSGGTGSGNDEGISNYYGRLATWLARHKRYPAQARRLRQEGTVKVTFTITSSGRVVSKRIVQSSGHALLDREVEAMLERASPLPRIPTSLGRKRLTITVPVAFALR